mgnify:CR=1 FL=1|jgi:GMP synthase (glutamine-hydrolysing)
MKNKVICVVHGEQSRTGRIGTIVRSLGFEEVRCCNRLGDPLPEHFDDIAGVCVFGGPMSANDDDTLPFIAAELAWIETVLAAQVPYLGICLGGQMLARCLGATVRPNPEGWHEIGYHRIAPTPCGAPLFGNLDYVYQWHGEGFELPRCCDLLATGVSGHFPNQAYRYGDKVFGLQFHPECTRDIIEWWMSGASEKLKERGAQQAEEQIAGACVHDDDIDAWTRAFLTEWLDAAPVHPAARIAAS